MQTNSREPGEASRASAVQKPPHVELKEAEFARRRLDTLASAVPQRLAASLSHAVASSAELVNALDGVRLETARSYRNQLVAVSKAMDAELEAARVSMDQWLWLCGVCEAAAASGDTGAMNDAVFSVSSLAPVLLSECPPLQFPVISFSTVDEVASAHYRLRTGVDGQRCVASGPGLQYGIRSPPTDIPLQQRPPPRNTVCLRYVDDAGDAPASLTPVDVEVLITDPDGGVVSRAVAPDTLSCEFEYEIPADHTDDVIVSVFVHGSPVAGSPFTVATVRVLYRVHPVRLFVRTHLPV